MITFAHLDWDTNFFNKKIGKVEVKDETEGKVIRYVQYKAEKEGYKLIYLFCPQDYAILQDGFVLVDKKVLFTCSNLTDSDHNFSLVSEYCNKKPTEELIKLAIQSGQYSRFKIDKNFNSGDFENLYKTWLLNSLNGKLADKVFVFEDKNQIIGFITVKITGESATIGLIAVNENFHGRNIGSLLVNQVKQYVYSKLVTRLNVVTQLNNKSACSFYEKNGFKTNLIKNIYHYWNIK